MNDRPHTIEVANQQAVEFDPDPLIAAITMIANDHSVSQAEVSVAVVDDPTIQKLNRQYLDHDYATDVISFVLDWNNDTGQLVGQLIVSIDTAITQAKQLNVSMADELLLYVVHGMLHLVGYDDRDAGDAQAMRLAEKRYLDKFEVQHRGFNDGAAPPSTQERL